MKYTTIALLSALTLSASAAIINHNAGMELGEIGRGVPGYFLDVNRADVQTVRKNPDKIYTHKTVAGGVSGQCLMIPGYTGVSSYQLELANILLSRDGEVEISFDAKIGPDENGKLHKSHTFVIDFRCFPDKDKDSYYPMLTAFSFRPGTEWKRFSKRYKIKAYSYYYNIWVLLNSLPSGATANSLYLDNFTLKYVDSKTTAEPEEYSVIPDRDDQLYKPGETVKYSIRARLNDSPEKINAVLKLKRDYNGTDVTSTPVKLTRGKDGTYTGKAEFKLNEFGSFATVLEIKGKKLRGIDSSVQVMHPAVNHPYGSFGWGIGVNDEALCPLGRSEHEGAKNYCLSFNSFERTFRLLKTAGVNIFRAWGHWRIIEPEKGNFTADTMGLEMDMLKKYQIEPLFILLGNFTVHGGQATVNKFKTKSVRGSSMPLYLYDYYWQSPFKNAGSVLPPMEIYQKYLEFVYANWGKDVRCWEMSNEPGVRGMPADRYIEYLKFTNAYIKKRNSSAILLGNGVTGDFGMNVVKWCDQLNAADKNYVDHLDGIAFHPYGCGLDYINGVRGLYEKCVKNIQSTLAKPKPMWNTETYYLPTARFRQKNNGREFIIYTSNELQRHFLDGFYNGVKASPSPASVSLFQRTERIVNLRAMSENAVAMNSLSFLLTGMKKLKAVDLGSMVRAGMFTDKDGKKALGFIYDLRSSGSEWIPAKANAQVLDLYGNKVSKKSYQLQFEPYYITGTPAEVEKLLKNSKFNVEDPVEMFGRRFGDTLFIEARNRTGIPGIVESKVSDLPVRFSFERDPEHATVKLNGIKQIPANIRMIKETPAYTLPATVKLTRGTTAEISKEKENLKIAISVSDSNMKAAEGTELWAGSAIEVFIDPTPFRNLSLNENKPLQFVFAALPSSTGVTAISTKNKNTKVSRSVKRTANGYSMEILIPLAELPPSDIYGIDIVIARQEKGAKESLGSDPGNSFRRRLHYHLISLGNTLPVNGDFSKASYGDPANWTYPIRSGATVDCSTKYGYNGNGLRIKVEKAGAPLIAAGERISIPQGKYTSGTIQILACFSDIRVKKPGRGAHGVIFTVATNRARTSLGKDKLKADISGNSGWVLYQFDFKIPPKTNMVTPEIGLGPETTGTLDIDSVSIKLSK